MSAKDSWDEVRRLYGAREPGMAARLRATEPALDLGPQRRMTRAENKGTPNDPDWYKDDLPASKPGASADVWCIFVRGKEHPLAIVRSPGETEDDLIERWRAAAAKAKGARSGSKAPRSQITAKPQATGTATGVKGRYRYWVVVKRRPHKVEESFTDTRDDAVRAVKAKVREHKTEGGVDSQDDRHPFEVTYSWKRGGDGELIETKH